MVGFSANFRFGNGNDSWCRQKQNNPLDVDFLLILFRNYLTAVLTPEMMWWWYDEEISYCIYCFYWPSGCDTGPEYKKVNDCSPARSSRFCLLNRRHRGGGHRVNTNSNVVIFTLFTILCSPCNCGGNLPGIVIIVK